MNPLTQAAQDVLAERARQVSAEGWTPDHDDEHREGAMASAAAVYCLCQEGPRKPGEPSELHSSRRWEFNILRAIWPSGWHFNPKDRRQNLVRAAALLLAEIERLDRAAGLPADAPAEQWPRDLSEAEMDELATALNEHDAGSIGFHGLVDRVLAVVRRTAGVATDGGDDADH